MFKIFAKLQFIFDLWVFCCKKVEYQDKRFAIVFADIIDMKKITIFGFCN